MNTYTQDIEKLKKEAWLEELLAELGYHGEEWGESELERVFQSFQFPSRHSGHSGRRKSRLIRKPDRHQHLSSSMPVRAQYPSELEINELKVATWANNYPEKVRDAIAMGGAMWPLAMKRAINSGILSASTLADLAFFMLYPERNGRAISRSEPGARDLINSWKFFREAAQNLLKAQSQAFSQLSPAPHSTGTETACKVIGQSIKCGDCTAEGNQRAKVELPLKTVEVRADLRFQGKRGLRLRSEVEAAWAELVAAARADGIPTPYLTIRSALRSYETQSKLWRDRLTSKFRKMGCREPVLSCLWRAADSTNNALKGLSIPHPKPAWISRFRQELKETSCRVSCGRGDPIATAVRSLSKTTAPPGRSKHHSGRALDIHLGSSISSKNVSAQRKTPAYHWLVCNAAHFGFAPYVAEPWHWEYTR